jgi:hypothetical protein
MRRKAALLLLPLLAACASAIPPPTGAPPPQGRQSARGVPPTAPPPPVTQGFRAPQVLRMAGLDDVIQKDAGQVMRLFGTPRLDMHEGDMRKLQFSGKACVLDVFLYPLRQGGEPVATWVDARRASDGLDVDRAACVAALAR